MQPQMDCDWLQVQPASSANSMREGRGSKAETNQPEEQGSTYWHVLTLYIHLWADVNQAKKDHLN